MGGLNLVRSGLIPILTAGLFVPVILGKKRSLRIAFAVAANVIILFQSLGYREHLFWWYGDYASLNFYWLLLGSPLPAVALITLIKVLTEEKEEGGTLSGKGVRLGALIALGVLSLFILLYLLGGIRLAKYAQHEILFALPAELLILAFAALSYFWKKHPIFIELFLLMLAFGMLMVGIDPAYISVSIEGVRFLVLLQIVAAVLHVYGCICERVFPQAALVASDGEKPEAGE